MAESDDSTGTWLATYADFITLLMCFFVALYAISSGISKSNFQAFISVFQSGKSVFQYESVVDPQVIHIQSQRSKNWEEFKQAIKKHNWEDDVKFEILAAGVKITLGENITFKTYSAHLAPEAKKVLKVIAHSIDKYTGEPLKAVQVTGHTDNRPVVSDFGKFTSNWELGAARAISVVQFLIKKSKTPEKKFKVVTFGKYHPIASNATIEGRRKNRRVEIFVKYMQHDAPPTIDDIYLPLKK